MTQPTQTRRTWMDITAAAARHGIAGPVAISGAAWMTAVYFVTDISDRNDPARERWRLDRLLLELAIASARQRGPSGALPDRSSSPSRANTTRCAA